jgi:hypothetical protein
MADPLQPLSTPVVVPTSSTPDDWRDALLSQLAARQPGLAKFDSYYKGEHKLLFATAKFREVFGIIFATFSDNWCDLVVDASAERLVVEGFRFDEDSQGDSKAWDIWQANDLDAESDLAHSESVKLGCSYALVGPDDGGEPTVQIEPPTNAIVALDPAMGRTRLAGLRDWVDEWGVEHCVVYLPDQIVWYHRDEKRDIWIEDEVGSGANPLGVVPLVPLPNAPTLRERQGRSDIERVIPLQDAVNKIAADMIVASEYAAFPQRWVTGIEIPVYPADHTLAGQPLPSFTQFLGGADRVFAVEDVNAKFGNFQVSDLGIYVKAIEMLIQHVAAQTRTPPHYLLGQSGAFPSGESLKATETGLVAKVKRKQLALGEGWEEVMRLCFKIEGDEMRSTSTSCETIWRNPEVRSTAEIVDAAVKLASIGVPRPALWEFVGATPQQVERWITEGEPEGPPVVARETIAASPGEASAQLPGQAGEATTVAPTSATEKTQPVPPTK